MRIVKERAREIHDGFVGKGSGPKREANIAAAARPSASVRPWGIHSCHGFFGWRRQRIYRTNERERARRPSLSLSRNNTTPARSFVPLQRPLEMDPGISLFPSFLSLLPYISLHRAQARRDRAREGAKVSRVGLDLDATTAAIPRSCRRNFTCLELRSGPD